MPEIKILVVEDERLVAQDIKSCLHSFGYRVTAIVSNGKDALKEARRNRPDLVLMDLILEGEWDGIETVRRLNRLLDVPVVYITAYSDDKSLEAAKLTQPFGYILKPIDEKELHIVVELSIFKHAAEKREKDRHERLSLFINPIAETLCLLDSDFHVIEMNETGMKSWGIRGGDLKKKDIFGLALNFPADQKAVCRQKLRETLDTGLPFQEDNLAVASRTGDRVVNVRAFKTGRGIGLIITDVTAQVKAERERQKIEEELGRSYQQLRNLSRHLQSIREEESKRIAREIHDELGQALTALKMDLSWLTSRLPESLPDRRILIGKTQAMTSLIDKTIKTVQKISAELRPGLLDDLGLVAAIEWQCQELESRTGIECEVKFDSEGIDLSSDLSTAIFRVLQEALTNAVRHSGATRINVNLKSNPDMLELQVRDNGIGIREEAINAADSLGIMGMRERLIPFGGILFISGEVNKGTTLTLSLPVKGREEHD